MKARLKHTNQIINVERDPLGWSWESPKGNVLLDTEELIFLDDDFDWQSFRAEAAKDILCVVVDNAISKGDVSSIRQYPELIHECILISDELIKQLKEKEDK